MNEIIFLVIGIVVGVAVGGAIVYFWAMGKVRANEGAGANLKSQLDERAAAAAQLQQNLDAEREQRIVAETNLANLSRKIEEQEGFLEKSREQLKDAFKALAADALKNNTETFGKATEDRVKPLKEALDKYEKQIGELEKTRAGAYGKLTEQMANVTALNDRLRKETANLVTALRSPQVRGRWGEITLRRAVEAAGMSPHCDFVEQASVDTDEGRQRPDMLVQLPGERTVVVDSKVSLQAYMDAVEAEDDDKRVAQLARHAKALRTHFQQLSAKAYWKQFERTPEFVVMYVPSEAMLAAALQQDDHIIQDGIAARVIVATPSTLITMLLTVAYSWQEERVAENAQKISEASKELFERVCKFAEHLERVGKGLERATDSYNQAIGSWQVRVLPSGRRVQELGGATGDRALPEMSGVDVTPRPLPLLEGGD